MVTLIGGMVIWSGYLLVTYGWSQLQSCNTGLRDLAWPGRTIGCNPDTVTGTPAKSSTAAAAAATKNLPKPIQRAATSGCNPLNPATWINPKCSAFGLITGKG